MKQTVRVTFCLLFSLFSPSNYAQATKAVAYFAGGCFWCVEGDFEKLKGVTEVVSGFTGGTVKNPTYKAVGKGNTGHVEAVKVVYDPKEITYSQLLQAFWRMINPTDNKGQFVDRGFQYTTGIFYVNEEQKKLAKKSIVELSTTKKYPSPIVTPVKEFKAFYAAEDYHQDYYKKNPVRYWYYRNRSGRDDYLKEIWGSK
ncbi:peptide-methionine (S)-S-oxide reductase MsrA [bacterium]|nr:peptide-methionine (S)-S-oxide reductase MsrA [bacterium]